MVRRRNWSRVAGIAASVAKAPLVVSTGYLSVLTVAAVTARRPGPAPSSGRPLRYVAVVPAHDEERLIGATVASLRAVAPVAGSGGLDVHVVADNCRDATAALARAAGAVVHERTAPERPGKGPALRWVLERLDEEGAGHDAVVFVDADTVVRPDLLQHVDDQLRRGAAVVQAHYAVRNEGSTPVVAFRAAALAARNYLRPSASHRGARTAGLYGNGMVFRAGVLRRHGFSDHLTEDAELQLELLEDGILVAFAPGARVEAEMPDTLEASSSQHERWERGRLSLARRFLPGLLRRSITGGPAGRVAYADAALDQVVPPFSVLVAANAAWLTAAVARTVVRPTGPARRDLALAAVVAAGQCAFVLCALRLVRAPASVYRALLRAPGMVVWKLKLWSRVLIRPEAADWIRTQRNEPGVGQRDAVAG